MQCQNRYDECSNGPELTPKSLQRSAFFFVCMRHGSTKSCPGGRPSVAQSNKLVLVSVWLYATATPIYKIKEANQEQRKTTQLRKYRHGADSQSVQRL